MRRIGQGACSVALLVERDGQDFILKAASDPQHNPRLEDEADLLSKEALRHSCIVDLIAPLEIGRYYGFLMRPVFADRDKRLIETLGHRLRREGRLHIDLLQRFGEDLLGAVNHLEEQGIPHRDIKPDQIAVGMVGGGKKLPLVLFDFSLSRTPADNIRAATTGYLDPLLPLRKPPRWDLHAERYATAVTLYELATVADLLLASPAGLWRLRGVGKKTCRELLYCQRFLRERLGTPAGSSELAEASPPSLADADVANWGLDLLMHRVFPHEPPWTREQETLAELKRSGYQTHLLFL